MGNSEVELVRERESVRTCACMRMGGGGAPVWELEINGCRDLLR
jgi:hypothetical protein